MRIRIIRSEADYEEALRHLRAAMEDDPAPGSRQADEMEALAFLVERYEKERYPLPAPDPVQAILFRMEQANLAPRDLVPMIGSRSKVSEVLAGKRPLSITMIRALHASLGIPAEVLIGPSIVSEAKSTRTQEDEEAEAQVKWEEFPVREMMARGYFGTMPGSASSKPNEVDARELLQTWMQPLNLRVPLAAPMLLKRTLTTRAARAMNPYALSAWSMRVLLVASQNTPSVRYDPAVLTAEFMAEVARLSGLDRGPLLAQEFLFRHGISLVIEPHLARTHLDGAAIAFWMEHPVIGLTLRHDRLDNFWFCLLHELAHLKLHFWTAEGVFQANSFYDDMEAAAADPREKETDATAGEALIPLAAWRKSPASVLPTPQAVQRLANELRVHPAVVAGRIRHERNSFRLLNSLVGQGEVRRHFPQVLWKGEEG